MTENQKDFLEFQAQTTQFSAAFEVDYAKGNYIYGKNGKAYLDFAAGVSANTLGHNHPRINKVLKEQIDRHLHVMVYGEYVQDKPLELCKKLASLLPTNLHTTYLLNSGAEAIDASLKLAKRCTGRAEIIAMRGAYHGNTHGALSVSDMAVQKRAFGPMLPGVEFIEFNQIEDISKITSKTAAVILETIQGAAGFITPEKKWLKTLAERCKSVGALLIFDEIQPGFGRTGKLFGFQHYGVVPDILVMGKGMASGMPIGALTASHELMKMFSHHPALGHITTFGGNPLVAAAALATLEELEKGELMAEINKKEALFRELLSHSSIKSIRGKGLMLALDLPTKEFCLEAAKRCMNKGLIVFWLLYRSDCMRITPPLTITEKEIREGCKIILEALDEVYLENNNS